MEKKDNETVDLRSLFIYYLSHWKLILVAGVISVIGASLYLIFYPKTYEGTAQILLQDDKDLFSSGSFGLGEAAGIMKSFGLGGGSSSGISLDDELVILTSNKLNREVAEKLGLYASYSAPRTFGYRMYGLQQLVVSMDSLNLNDLEHTIKLDIHQSKEGKITVKSKIKTGTFKSIKNKFELTELPATLNLGRYSVNLDYAANYVKDNNPFTLEIEINPLSAAAETLVDDMFVDDYSKSSNILQLTLKDYETRRLKDIFTVLIDCYNNQARDYKVSLGNNSLSFINDRLYETMRELQNIESGIESYKTKNKITVVEYDMQMYAASMQELQSKLIELESQIHLINLMEEFINNPENKYKLIPSLFSAPEGETGILYSYNQILLERESAIKSSSELNPMVQTMTAQADELRKSVHTMINNSKKTLDFTRQDLKSKENQLMSKMSSIPTQERLYVDLKRQQEIYQGVYLILLQKREDILLTIGQNKDRARIVDTPYIKTGTVAPRKLFALIGIIAFTFLISAGWLSVKYLFTSIWGDLKAEIKKKK